MALQAMKGAVLMSHFTVVAGKPGGGKSRRIIELLRSAGTRAVLLDGDHNPSQIRQLTWETRADIRYTPNRSELLKQVESISLDTPVHVFIDVPFLTPDDYRELHAMASEKMPVTVTLQLGDTSPADQLFETWSGGSFNLVRV